MKRIRKLQAPALSPSLQPVTLQNSNFKQGATGAYELKFLVDQQVAERMLVQAARALAVDPFCNQPCPDGGPGLGYWIKSLYLDSPSLAVYRRQPGYSRRKYRIRRYGESDTAFLERKRKRRGLVAKRRTTISLSDLPKLLTTSQSNSTWDGDWFQKRLLKRSLQPTMRIGYFRRALMGQGDYGTIRLTYDTNFDCKPTSNFVWPTDPERSINTSGNLFSNCGVLELKFREVLPSIFREWIETFGLQVSSCSKYRTAVAASGIAEREVRDA